MEHKLLVDIEVRGQRKYRRAGAAATLSRTDWEIAHQEILLAVRVLRAYNAVLYRQEKIKLIDQIIRINENAARQIESYVKQGKMRPADQILIRAEVAEARAQRAQGLSLLIPARQELYRALGLLYEEVKLLGALDVPLVPWDGGVLTTAAIQRRADLRAQQAAVAEAEAKVQLTVANRFGNPNIGPAYEYNETRVNFIGAQITLPLPVFNTHRGEIMQSEAERSKAYLQLRQTEMQVRQDIRAALARLEQAKGWVQTYDKTVVPSLEQSLKQLRTLFEAADPGVTVLSLIDVIRKWLRARDVELDARWEFKQAQIDLAAAVGEPALAISPETALEPSPSCLAQHP
jgi:cobalt-zinc-cadmium efflux system outer membrane protein